jgi:hypothetical protein
VSFVVGIVVKFGWIQREVTVIVVDSEEVTVIVVDS